MILAPPISMPRIGSAAGAADAIASANQRVMCSGRVIAEPTTTAKAPARIASRTRSGVLKRPSAKTGRAKDAAAATSARSGASGTGPGPT